MKNMFRLMREHANDNPMKIGDDLEAISAVYAYLWIFLIVPVMLTLTATHIALKQYSEAVSDISGGFFLTLLTYGAYRYTAWEAYNQEVDQLMSAWMDSLIEDLKK